MMTRGIARFLIPFHVVLTLRNAFCSADGTSVDAKHIRQKNCFEKACIRIGGFLTNDLRVASSELRAIIYCTSYKLLFTCVSRVTDY